MEALIRIAPEIIVGFYITSVIAGVIFMALGIKLGKK